MLSWEGGRCDRKEAKEKQITKTQSQGQEKKETMINVFFAVFLVPFTFISKQCTDYDRVFQSEANEGMRQSVPLAHCGHLLRIPWFVFDICNVLVKVSLYLSHWFLDTVRFLWQVHVIQNDIICYIYILWLQASGQILWRWCDSEVDGGIWHWCLRLPKQANEWGENEDFFNSLVNNLPPLSSWKDMFKPV